MTVKSGALFSPPHGKSAPHVHTTLYIHIRIAFAGQCITYAQFIILLRGRHTAMVISRLVRLQRLTKNTKNCNTAHKSTESPARIHSPVNEHEHWVRPRVLYTSNTNTHPGSTYLHHTILPCIYSTYAESRGAKHKSAVRVVRGLWQKCMVAAVYWHNNGFE